VVIDLPDGEPVDQDVPPDGRAPHSRP
jgi:hypothetical protein